MAFAENHWAMRIYQATRIIAAIALVQALFEMPEDYYKALRLIVVAAAVLEICQIQKGAESQNVKTAWTLALSGIAIMLNPVLPLDLEREQWVFVDLLGAGIFAWRAFPDIKRWLEKVYAAEVPRQGSSQYITTPPPLPIEDNQKIHHEDINKAKSTAFVILICVSAFVIGLIALLIFISIGRDSKAMTDVDYDRYQRYVMESKKEEEAFVSQSSPTPEPEIRSALPVEVSDGIEVRRAIPLTYLVQPGDSPYLIAHKLGVSYARLLSENGIYDATKIRVGQELKIPQNVSAD